MNALQKLALTQANNNYDADRAVSGLLEGLGEDAVTAARGSYFNSLLGLYNHLLVGNAFCFMQFAKLMPDCFTTLDPHNIANTLGSFSDIKKLLLATDGEMVTAVKSNLSLLETEFDFFGSNTSLILAMTDWYGHNFYHRGQISQILDELGIKHSFYSVKAENL